MSVILVFISTFVLTNALVPATNKRSAELSDKKVKEVISKYVAKVPDIKEQYVIDERLSKAISHYFKGKLSAFPLFKVSVKIDRNPVLIPWTMGDPNANIINQPTIPKKKNKHVKKRYKIGEIVKQDTVTTGKPVEIKDLTTPDPPVVTTFSPIKNTTM